MKRDLIESLEQSLYSVENGSKFYYELLNEEFISIDVSGMYNTP